MSRRRTPRRYVVTAVLGVMSLLAALIGPAVYAYVTDTSAKDRIAADPPPTLFPTTTAEGRIAPLVAGQSTRAAQLLEGWFAEHGSTADDAAFTTWVESVFPAPPTPPELAEEMPELRRLEAARTDAGVTAATWLEAHGKKDVWKLEAHDQAEYLTATVGDAGKNVVDDVLSLTKTIADDLGNRFQTSAPYVVEPSLRTDHTVVAGQVCPCGYPSRHASAAAASRVVLAGLMPQRDAEYRWWQSEIDYSRLYMAGHYPTDITAGTLLGDLVGDYMLVTREGVDPTTLG